MKSKQIKKTAEKKLNSSENSLELIPLDSSRDNFIYKLYYKKVYLTIFQISHGSKEFGQGLISLMARQLGIKSSELKGIANCTFWGKDFIKSSTLITSLTEKNNSEKVAE
ncbi:hypothetical protein KJ980_03655 [Patescibacteria group bacterium]|nr:hypothetical protein [Patescibacteria group bacterium]MBU4098718.1 hypothetical protein [Patescibacteria group bacterium]